MEQVNADVGGVGVGCVWGGGYRAFSDKSMKFNRADHNLLLTDVYNPSKKSTDTKRLSLALSLGPQIHLQGGLFCKSYHYHVNNQL